MENNGILQQARMRHWANVMSERKNSGKNVMTWCMENNINKRTYYNWQRKLQIAAYEQAAGIQESEQARHNPAGFTQVVIREGHGLLRTEGVAGEAGEVRVEAAGLRISADSTYPTEKLASLVLRLVGI